MKTITELSKLDGRVYVHLSTPELGRQFMEQAESEGFTFEDGVRPTEREAALVMAVNSNHTINYVGFVGMVAYGAGTNRMGNKRLIRVSYQRNGDFLPEKADRN